MGWFDPGELFGKEQTERKTEYEAPRIAPEYEEAKGARGRWWDTLNTWGSQPGYGAIQPNWSDLWENARGKVRRYFGGGPEGPGAVDRLRSDAARRGMGDNPATSRGIARLGMKEGQMLQDIAVEQAMKEAMLGEQGRTTWLSSLMSLAGLKPQLWDPGSTTIGTAGGGEGWDILGSAAGMGTAMAMGGAPAMASGGGIYPGMSVTSSNIGAADPSRNMPYYMNDMFDEKFLQYA